MVWPVPITRHDGVGHACQHMCQMNAAYRARLLNRCRRMWDVMAASSSMPNVQDVQLMCRICRACSRYVDAADMEAPVGTDAWWREGYGECHGL